MTTLYFVGQARQACERAQQACEDGQDQEGVELLRQALHLYQKAIYVEKDEEGKALILHQCEVLMLRIKELACGSDEEEDEEEEKEENKDTRKPRKKNKRALAPARVQESGESGFHEELRALRLSGDQLGDLSWNDVIGLGEVKQQLLMCTRVPRELPHLFTGEMATQRGILLYGPPGVGKTRIMKALAHESGMAFLPVTTADIISKYVGESMRYIKALFEVLREMKPCILFVDEIDGLCGSRDAGNESGEVKRAVGQFLQELDGVCEGRMEGILFVGATNLPWTLDSGILRRMDTRYYVPLPDLEARFNLLLYNCGLYPRGIGASLDQDCGWHLAELMANFSGSDIASVVKAAYKCTVEQVTSARRFKGVAIGEEKFLVPAEEDDQGPNILTVTYDKVGNKAALMPVALNERHIKQAMQTIKPTTEASALKAYEEWTEAHGKKV